MGKANRVKQNKASVEAQNLGSYRKKEGMPNWAVNLITIVIVLAILLSGVVIWLSSNGIIMRTRTAMKSENFRVDGNMMTYYFNSTYQNFLSSYSTYLSYFSLDTTKSLQSQQFGDTSVKANAWDTMFLGEFQGTWFDYFMSQTESEVKSMLLYCEEAKKMNIELTQQDYDDINTTIESIKSTATTLGYTANAYFANAFGEGVQEKDIRNAMELSQLANKGMSALGEKLLGEVTADRIQAAYEENPTAFNLIDYTYYAFGVSYEEVSKEVKAEKSDASDEEILEAYKKEIEEAKEKADKLMAVESLDAFEEYILNEMFDTRYEVEYEGASFPEDMELNDEQLATIRNGIAAQIIDELRNEKDPVDAIVKSEDDKYIAFNVEITKEIAEEFNDIKNEVYEAVALDWEASNKEKTPHTDGDEFFSWAFHADRKVGDMKKLLSGDGSEEGKEVTVTEKNFYARVYRLSTTQYKDAEKTKDIAYMTFATEDAAKDAIAALIAAGSVDQATFDRIAAEKQATSDILENYVKGDMGNSSFDNWVFDADTKIGSYTATPIKLSETSYAVLYYTADGDEAWYVSVQTDLFNDDFDAYFNTMEQTYPVTIKANVLKKVKVIAA